MTRCIFCNKKATEKHHIIFKSQGGSNDPVNIANLCSECHYAIHHGIKSGYRNKIIARCYEQIKSNLDKAWIGKIKPKQIIQLEDKNDLQ